MSFIKTFQDFTRQPVQVSEKMISGGSVTKGTANLQAGELGRFTVVLKATAENDTISDANPAQSALEMLISNQEFKTWYANSTTVSIGSNISNVINNSNTVCFIETGKHRQAGLLKREKATETFVFKVLATTAAGTEAKSEIKYDLSKFPTQAKAQVATGGTIYAWNSEQEADMKLSKTVTVDIPFKDLTIDSVMKLGKAATQPAATVSTASTASSGQADSTQTQAQTGTSGAGTTSTAKYAGLKSSSSFDQKVQDLQKLIVAKGGNAAASINSKGGADGKYGSGTANAIGILIGTNKEEKEITADIDAKLQTALAGVTVTNKPTTAKASTGAATKSATKPKVVAKADPF